MISRIIDEKAIDKVRQLLLESEKIVITCHLTPDGDAIGSSLGLCHVLRSIGKDAVVVTPDLTPKSLQFLPGVNKTVAFTRQQELAAKLFADADMIFCLDFNESPRVDLLEPILLGSKAPKVMIDHHLHPGSFADVVISYPKVSSTAMLVFRVLCRLELFDRINREAAECIYTGMMTDTGNFSYNSNDPDLYVVIAELLKKGVDKDSLYQRACNTFSESSLRLNGYALSEKMELLSEHKCSLIALNAAELARFNYEKGDTEGLVNKPLAMPDVVWSVYLREDPNQIKISMRSKGDFPVNAVCKDVFGGGGHLNAAGAEFKGTLVDCIKKLKNAMANYDNYLPKHQSK